MDNSSDTEMFNGESLSFDSTLEGLIGGDYNELVFNPSSVAGMPTSINNSVAASSMTGENTTTQDPDNSHFPMDVMNTPNLKIKAVSPSRNLKSNEQTKEIDAKESNLPEKQDYAIGSDIIDSTGLNIVKKCSTSTELSVANTSMQLTKTHKEESIEKDIGIIEQKTEKLKEHKLEMLNDTIVSKTSKEKSKSQTLRSTEESGEQSILTSLNVQKLKEKRKKNLAGRSNEKHSSEISNKIKDSKSQTIESEVKKSEKETKSHNKSSKSKKPKKRKLDESDNGSKTSKTSIKHPKIDNSDNVEVTTDRVTVEPCKPTDNDKQNKEEKTPSQMIDDLESDIFANESLSRLTTVKEEIASSDDNSNMYDDEKLKEENDYVPLIDFEEIQKDIVGSVSSSEQVRDVENLIAMKAEITENASEDTNDATLIPEAGDINMNNGEDELHEAVPTLNGAINNISKQIDQKRNTDACNNGLGAAASVDNVTMDTDDGPCENGEFDDVAYLDSEEEMDDNEIHAWLEAGVQKPDNYVPDGEINGKPELKGEGDYTEKEKIVLEVKGVNHFEVLPEGWVSVTHDSGMNIYLHKTSRVCTLAKPYFLGPGSVRKHNIPLSAVPCLHYRREKEKEEGALMENGESDRIGEHENRNTNLNGGPDVNGEPTVTDTTSQSNGDEESLGAVNRSTVNVQSASLINQQVSIGSEELYDYCKGLFNFKTVKVKKFKTWKEKRQHMNEEKKKENEKNLPGIPSEIKLIKCSIPAEKGSISSAKKKEFVLNPEGKTPVCILHEYTQYVMKNQPTYVFKELENAQTPYKATVVINGIQYGAGAASSKRQAKSEAAQAALEIFVPSLTKQWTKDPTVAGTIYKNEVNAGLSYFEGVPIEDPRVWELCDKAALPKPFQVLHDCLHRNFGLGDTTIDINKKMISNQKTEFSLTVGKHTVTVICKNKREGKQFAAQKMLKVLHPNLTSWASILKLYSKSNVLGFKERTDTNEVLNKESRVKNFEILSKLKMAMMKIKELREQVDTTKTGLQPGSGKPIDL